MDDLISRLSEIRSEYNCFDENEEPYYRALSEAIKILYRRADGDTISRQAVKDWLQKWIGYLDNDMIARMQYRVIDIPSAQPEIIRCKDCKYNINNPRLFHDNDPIMTYSWCNTEYFDEGGFCPCGKRKEV